MTDSYRRTDKYNYSNSRCACARGLIIRTELRRYSYLHQGFIQDFLLGGNFFGTVKLHTFLRGSGGVAGLDHNVIVSVSPNI